MKKFLVGVAVAAMLTGCGEKVDKENNTAAIFREEIATVSKIGDATGKELSDEIVLAEIDWIFENIFESDIFEDFSVKYGEIVQGAGSDGHGGKVFCCKLPVDVMFAGNEKCVEEFVKYFEDIDKVISFGDFKVDEIEDGKYEVHTVINFLGKASGGSLEGSKKLYTIKKNEVEVEEEEQIVLRDYDISMVIRPSNSDAAAISLGVINDGDHRVYNDENLKKDVNVTFSNDGNKYYCKYNIGDDEVEEALITPSGNILFDVLSCDVEESDDEIEVDLHVFNNSNKKVSIAVFDDKDGRVNIVEKVGNVEVKK